MNKLPNKSSLLCSDSGPTKTIWIPYWLLALVLVTSILEHYESYNLALRNRDRAYQKEQACKDIKACECRDAYWASRSAERNYRRNGYWAEDIKQEAYQRERDCKVRKLNECRDAYWASRKAEDAVNSKQFWKTNTIE